MTLAFLDKPSPDLGDVGPVDDATPVVVLAPRHYQERAQAAFDDTALLLSAILPAARVEHVGASAVPGAYSRGGVDVCVSVPREGYLEALGVLGEAGFALRRDALRDIGACLLDAPANDVPLALWLLEAGPVAASCVQLRDTLRDDARLLARYNALRLEAATRGAAAYRDEKSRFIRAVLGEAGSI